MQAHGIRESDVEPRLARARPDRSRRARSRTCSAAPDLVTEIWRHHTEAPTFTGLTLPSLEVFLADWEETLEAPGHRLLRRRARRRVVGHLLLELEEPDLARPPGSIYLAVAATSPRPAAAAPASR